MPLISSGGVYYGGSLFMNKKDTPLRRLLDWCMVLFILAFTIGQLFSHFEFSRKNLEYLEFTDSQIKTLNAVYDYLEFTNALSTDMCQYAFTGEQGYINDYFIILNGKEYKDTVNFVMNTDSSQNFADTVGEVAKSILDFELYILKLSAVSCNVPEYQMDEILRNIELTPEDKALSRSEQMIKASEMAFSENYRNTKAIFGVELNEFASNLTAKNNLIQNDYAELIKTKTKVQQTSLLLSGALMLLIVMLLYRQMLTINNMLTNEKQYKGALITDAIGVFEVNLTEDRIEAILSEKGDRITNELKRLKLSVPCSLSEFIGAAIPCLPPADAVAFELFSPAYFINQFNKGNRFITRESWYTGADERHLYLRNSILLSKRQDTDSVYALIVFRDITSEQMEYEKQRQLVEMSMRSGQQYLDALRTDSVGIYESNITRGTIDRIISDTADHKVARFFEEAGILLPGKVSQFKKSIMPLFDDTNRQNLISYTSEELTALYKKGVKNQIAEFWINMPDGTRRYLKNTMLLRKEEGSGDLIAICIIKDDTEQRLESEKRQMELIQEKANNEAKVKFFSRMSHDIRTPLNGVIGMIDLVRHHMDEPERVRDYIDKIDQSSRHLLSLVNDVLDMSVVESGKLEITRKSVNLKAITDECCVILNSQLLMRDIVLEVDTETIKTPYVLSDPVAIKKILMNILSNAVKFTGDNGHILFKTEYSYSFDGTQLNAKYTISDTGMGMSEEFLQKIFEPFTQEKEDVRTHYQGTGLGMSIVKQYVDALGGTISVTSRKDEGSTFVVELPFEIDSSNQNDFGDVAPKQNDVSGLKVLLVDDNELNIEIVQMLLEDQGVVVKTASNGQKAVDIFTQSEEGYYDAIIMDIMMPIMDGLEATKAIRSMALTRKDAVSVPIIALTANAFASDLEKTEAAGMTAHLSKPIVPNMLMETLTRCCRGS